MHFPATRAAAARTRRLSGPPTILDTRTGIVGSTRLCLRNRRFVGLGSLRGSSDGLVSRPKLAFPSDNNRRVLRCYEDRRECLEIMIEAGDQSTRRRLAEPSRSAVLDR